MTLSLSSTGNLIFGLLISGISSCLPSLKLENNSKPENLLSDTQDYPIISLDFLDYSFQALIDITNVIWYTCFNVA